MPDAMIAIHFKESAPNRSVVDVVPTDEYFRIPPRGFNDFRDFYVNNKPVNFSLAEADITITKDGKVKNFPGRVKFPLARANLLEFAALLPGGWLPAMMAQVDIFMPDRNIAGNVSAQKAMACPFTGLESGARFFHPLFTAMEGRHQRFPTPQEIHDQAHELASKMHGRYPDRVVEITAPKVMATYNMVEERRQSWAPLCAFFRAVWPHLRRNQSDVALVNCFDQVKKAWNQCRGSGSPLAYLLVLDCIYVKNNTKAKACPGVAVLKPELPPTDANLYNVCSDIWMIEQAIKHFHVLGSRTSAVCTNDRGVIGAWALFSPREFSQAGESVKFTCNFPDEFAERMSEGLRTQVLEETQASST